MKDQTLYLERPSFWTEERDPECWRRGIKALAELEEKNGIIRGTPRSLWEHSLKQVMSRRSILGLFGMSHESDRTFLLGVGFLEYDFEQKGWRLTEFAKPLLADDLEDREALTSLGITLLQRSPWIRLLVTRLLRGDWALSGWRSLRKGRGKLTAGASLRLHHFTEEADWFSGIETLCAQAWLPEETATDRAIAKSTDLVTPHPDPLPSRGEGKIKDQTFGNQSFGNHYKIRLHPQVLTRDSRRDDFSWAPFKAPLYLFDYLGWLVEDGDLRLPVEILREASLESGPKAQLEPGARLRRIMAREADLRGFVPVEKALRKLYEEIHPGQSVSPEEFVGWMDALMSCALKKGAIEILAAEPGQARHGRGLFGDRQRKLAKWIVHDDFNGCLAELEGGFMKAEPEKQHTADDV
ncbi:MAG: hypothetical protein FJ135_04675 [Deltaproteobacteria bacterium]|nr:hypothetical protein [Deltaproteobacteria bacterium]